MALDESFRHAAAEIDRGRDPPCSIQLLSGIWLCYGLNSLHGLAFRCSHPNSLVSFLHEAPSQSEVAVASSVAQSPYLRAIADAFSLLDHDVSLYLGARNPLFGLKIPSDFGLFHDLIEKSLMVPVQ